MKKRLTKKAPVRKYEGGGVATAQTKEEQAKSAMDLLTKAPVTSSTPTPAVKKRADGFESDAQKEAYIKNAKAMLAKDKTVADLVKMKFGTAAGLKALGITDSKPATSGKTSAPAKTYKSKKDSTEVVVTAKKKDDKSTKSKTTTPAKTQNTDYKKQWNNDILNKAASNKKMTAKELTYVRQKYGKDTNLRGEKKSGTVKEKIAYKNAITQQFNRVKPAMQEVLSTAMGMQSQSLFKRPGSLSSVKSTNNNQSNTTSKPKSSTNATSKTKDPIKQAESVTKKNRSAINKTQKGGIDAILRKGEGATTKTKDVIKQATNINKKNSASINKTQKGGIDKILRKAENKPKVKDPISKSTNTMKSNRSSINKTQKSGLDNILKKGESTTKIKKK